MRGARFDVGRSMRAVGGIEGRAEEFRGCRGGVKFLVELKQGEGDGANSLNSTSVSLFTELHCC
jgi:hypothetical protein